MNNLTRPANTAPAQPIQATDYRVLPDGDRGFREFLICLTVAATFGALVSGLVQFVAISYRLNQCQEGRISNVSR